MAASYGIRAAATRTGVPAHTIRAWERRYGALSPSRSGTNRRVYDPSDIERLVLLRDAVARGHAIGSVAGLPTDALRQLTNEPTPSLAPQRPSALAECLSATESLDAEALSDALKREAVVNGIESTLRTLIVPFIQEIESRWLIGSLGIAHEHLASAVLRSTLDEMRHSIPVKPSAPRMVVGTPTGQTHELGALIASVVCAVHGWNVVYLGANLPADDIAGAVRRTGASGIALSIVHPEGDPSLMSDLVRLRGLVGSLEILVGGRATESYATVLEVVTARVCLHFDAFVRELERLQ